MILPRRPSVLRLGERERPVIGVPLQRRRRLVDLGVRRRRAPHILRDPDCANFLPPFLSARGFETREHLRRLRRQAATASLPGPLVTIAFTFTSPSCATATLPTINTTCHRDPSDRPPLSQLPPAAPPTADRGSGICRQLIARGCLEQQIFCTSLTCGDRSPHCFQTIE